MRTPSLKSLLFLCLVWANGLLFSQTENDSIRKLINAQTGDARMELYFKIGEKLRSKGQNDKALFYAQEAEKYSLSINGDYLGGAYNEIALAYQAKSEFDKALNYLLKSLQLYEKKDNLVGLCIAQNNIGELYRKMRNYTKAIECMEASLKMGQKLRDLKRIADAEISLGALYYDVSDLEKSVAYFKSALVYYKSINSLTDVAIMQNNIGSINNELGKYKEAIANYKSAMEIFLQFKDTLNYSMCVANIGNVYNVMGDYNEGVQYSEKGLKLALGLKDNNIISSCYIFLAEGYTGIGDFKKAFEYQTRLLALKDTMYDLQSNQNVADMQTRYDTEKKDRENQILKQQNELQNLSINRQRIISYSITFGLILVLGLAFFIYRGYKEKKKANLQLEEKNVLIEEKNKIVEEKNKDITDSIRYAKRLQSAILKPEHELKNYFKDSFILFRPKDIVSGDFYWFEKFGNLTMVAAADCTGHGVPGAFMSIIGCNLLSQAVNEYAITHPGAILNSLNKNISKVLQQKNDEDSVKDGMDIALIVFDQEKMKLEYAGAYNSLWIIRNERLIEYKADKFPIGAFVGDNVRQFNNQEISVEKGDVIYVFSDGYADQFGGPTGKKFKYKQLQNLLLHNVDEPLEKQKFILERELEKWMGGLEQVDDILIVGVKIC